jgi:ribonuclease R
MEERPEYRWVLTEKKKIERIEKCEKLLSQKLVEECMIAANRCCARFLRDRGCAGPFIAHRGFRPDRKDEINRFVSRFLPDFNSRDLNDLAVYREVMVCMMRNAELPLRSMANRLLARAELLDSPAQHMGMGLDCYSNCTSPLRKYVDYLAHRQIKALLRGEACQALSKNTLQALSDRVSTARAAAREAELWLQCEYLSDKLGQEYEAVIVQISSSGFTARLVDSGIEGVVDVRGEKEKFSFDRWAAQLASPTRSFRLEQTLTVRVEKADAHRREIVFSPASSPRGENNPSPSPPAESSQ